MRKMENFIPASSEENLRPLEMPDCIYFDGAVQVRNSQCKRVFEKAVSLFQSGAKREESLLRWCRRLNGMDEDRQTKIAVAYYGGKKPWKDWNRKER